MTSEKRWSAFIFILVAIMTLGMTLNYVPGKSKELRVVETGLASVKNWGESDGLEYRVFDFYFSRNILCNKNGSGVEYRIIDGTDGADDDYKYFQDYITVNGTTVREINKTTDTEGWDFKSFPSTIGGIYSVPVIIRVPETEPNHLQFRLHKRYISDVLKITDSYGQGLEIKFLNGMTNTGNIIENQQTEYVEFVFNEDVTCTKGDLWNWSCDKPFTKYVEDEEIIERADIDFSKINYEHIEPVSCSAIIKYGTETEVKGEKRSPIYLSVYFDKPLCNQFIPYVSWGKKDLKSLAGVKYSPCEHMTKAQVDAIFDYRIDLAFKDFIKIDGLTIKEMLAKEQNNSAQELFIHLSGDVWPTSFTIYMKEDSDNWLNPDSEHTLEILSGFVSPLFGKTDRDYKFYYNPGNQSWSTVDYSKEQPVYDWRSQEVAKGGCNSSFGGEGVTMVALLSVSLIMLAKRRGN